METTVHPATRAAGAFRTIDAFAEANAERRSGVQLRLIREAAPRFRAWLAATGTPDYVGTFDLVSLPYPSRYGLFRVGGLKSPFVTITNRMIVVRFRDGDGRRRTLLFEPTDVDLARNTPYFAELARRMPAFAERLVAKRHGTVLGHLRALGIAPEDVDYLTFDHLHTQDVRRLVGTRGPARDLSPNGAIPPLFPNAKLVVQRRELESIPELHPLQRPWYQPETYVDLRDEALLVVDGDVLLGPGVALLSTPGHTPGNHSLALHTDSGIWVSSENAIAVECLVPEHSAIPGVARTARSLGQELVLNGNTIETTAEQYNALVKEKLVADASRVDPRFPQFFPSSELSPGLASPGLAPTFMHRRIAHGALGPR
jgi:hypothetical protein